MCLHIADGFRIDTGLSECRRDQVCLGIGIGNRIPAGLSAGIDGGRQNDSVDVVSVGNGPIQRFQYQSPHTLPVHKAVRLFSKAPADPVTGQHVHLTEPLEVHGMKDEIHPTGQRHCAIPVSDALTGHMNGRKRRRAGGVNGKAGPLEIEEIGNPVCNRPVCRSRSGGMAFGKSVSAEPFIIAVHHPHENPHAVFLFPQPSPAVTGTFKGCMGRLKKQPFLGIHGFGLPG